MRTPSTAPKLGDPACDCDDRSHPDAVVADQPTAEPIELLSRHGLPGGVTDVVTGHDHPLAARAALADETQQGVGVATIDRVGVEVGEVTPVGQVSGLAAVATSATKRSAMSGT